ncbi:hypothetical protein PGTUg99_025372 [Puccinia graminis f. sp. tritici]|uniref:DUF4219 domain-containing protein n=1 Tax=Puccinia graminis f. sp. tritici TaxID=56615 RepID=A0A5B0NWV2_PUCGR|nr:hypothetical protein PGTUg99_025372 [Puccinia graminis f. sp. tritici]
MESNTETKRYQLNNKNYATWATMMQAEMYSLGCLPLIKKEAVTNTATASLHQAGSVAEAQRFGDRSAELFAARRPLRSSLIVPSQKISRIQRAVISGQQRRFASLDA